MRRLLSVPLALGLLLGAAPVAAAGEPVVEVASNLNSSSIPIAMTREYDGRNLKIRRKLSENSAYTRYQATYLSGDLKICGILIEPKGKGPFPMVVLAHGYIDPKVYVTGQGFRREQDWLARNGYGVLHVDYRNHACSDKDPRNDVNMRLGYAEDVINAGLAIRNSDLPWIDGDRVAVLGRSMGGGVTYQALAIAPGVFDAAITYASVSSNAADNFNRWQRNNYDIGERILAKFGEPKDNPEAWRQMSSRNYFFRITEPVLAFHGTADDTCEISWARATKSALDEAGVENQLVEYKGAGHYFYSPWSDSIKKVGRFLDKHLAST
ncbi:MAG: alpha/beta hydrolase family protein [Candidatus Nanopelagicales bacterium]